MVVDDDDWSGIDIDGEEGCENGKVVVGVGVGQGKGWLGMSGWTGLISVYANAE